MKRAVVGFFVGVGLYGVARLFGLSGLPVAAIIVLSVAAGASLTLWIEDSALKEARDQ
ncbi:hypothetical protein LCGC14_2474200 [marine sediment metagenome]|uniref:Uncharacterized protein n=1 Tax=marine sediment metagenome TaxID=412755 RepID=A0A0F9DLK9_9ZZZZ